MPRVYHVKKARKDHPRGGIKKGESYYWWKFRFGGKHYSRTMPRPSQLTQSDKLSRVYAAQESVQDVLHDEDLDLLRSACEEAASEVREVGEEYQESCDNIRDQFTDSPTADECEEKAEACSSLADELEYLDFDGVPEKPDEGDEPEEPERPGEEPQEDDPKTWNGYESYEAAMKTFDALTEQYEQYAEALEEYENRVQEYEEAVDSLRDEIDNLSWDLC